MSSTQPPCCVTSRKLFYRVAKSRRPSIERFRRFKKFWRSGRREGQAGWLNENIARYQPLSGGSFIPPPPALRPKKAIVNVKNKDDHCFWWTVRAARFPVDKDPQRPSKYPQEDGLNPKGIDSPTPISQIPKVERQNDMAVNVFGWDKGAVVVHHISKQPEDIPRINMLLIEKAGKTHYTRIKDLNRLLYDRSKHRERKHFCERCLHGYTREDLLEAHKPECHGLGQTAVRVEMPEEGKNKLTFQDRHKQPLHHLCRL